MKIGLILPTNLYFAPYINIYTKILDSKGIQYDIISWDRAGVNENFGVVFKYYSPFGRSKVRKLFDYYKYVRFAINQIKEKKYDKLIIFGSQTGLFMFFFLRKNYAKKILFDYRDLSIEQFLKRIFCKFLNLSSLNVISSPGFKQYLPKGYNYILSHNFQIESIENVLKSAECDQTVSFNEKINIMTIGALRDYEVNSELMEALKNDDRFFLNFIGKGIAETSLRNYASKSFIENVNFHGYYNKSDEEIFVKDADFLNIYYPQIKTHSSALSNRFYIALLYKKPMIVTKNSIQGNYVEKYNLGISIENCDNLKSKIESYIEHFNEKEYLQNSTLLLKSFTTDYYIFVQNIDFFLES